MADFNFDEVQAFSDQILAEQLSENEAKQILLREMDTAASAAQAEYKVGALDSMLQDLSPQVSQTRVITNKTIDDMYAQMQIDPDYAVRSRVPIKPDAKISVMGNVKLYQDPNDPEGRVVVAFPKAPDPQTVNKQLLDKSAGIKSSSFNIREEIAKLKDLKGDELAAHSETVMMNANMEIARRKQLIEQQARIQSGLKNAEEALHKTLANSYNSITAAGQEKVKNAQSLYNAALQAHAKLSDTLIKSDPIMAELVVGTQLVQKVEISRSQREQASKDKKEQKAAVEQNLLDAVPAHALQNYKYLIGSTETDPEKVNDERRQVLAKSKQNKDFEKVVMATPDTIKYLLVDPNPKIRQEAYKILVGYDKLRFPDLRNADAISTPTLDEYKLKDILNDPMKLAVHSAVPSEIRAELMKFKQMRVPGGAKVAEQKETELLGRALEAYIQNVNKAKPTDMTTWRTAETVDGSPLRAVINQVSATRKNGDAPFDLVIETFMQTPTKNADGSDMKVLDKKLILMNGIRQVVSQYEKQWLQPDMSGIQALWIERINNLTNLAAMRSQLRDVSIADPFVENKKGQVYYQPYTIEQMQRVMGTRPKPEGTF